MVVRLFINYLRNYCRCHQLQLFVRTTFSIRDKSAYNLFKNYEKRLRSICFRGKRERKYCVFILRSWRHVCKQKRSLSDFVTSNIYSCIELNAQMMVNIYMNLRNNGFDKDSCIIVNTIMENEGEIFCKERLEENQSNTKYIRMRRSFENVMSPRGISCKKNGTFYLETVKM